MTARQKKIASKKVSSLTTEQLAELWKINFNKKLDKQEMEQFEMIRKEYKKKSGKMLPANSHKKTK
jgi:hypothetical protein